MQPSHRREGRHQGSQHYSSIVSRARRCGKWYVSGSLIDGRTDMTQDSPSDLSSLHYCDACYRLLETSITLLFGVISFADEVAPSESMIIELVVHCSINART